MSDSESEEDKVKEVPKDSDTDSSYEDDVLPEGKEEESRDGNHVEINGDKMASSATMLAAGPPKPRRKRFIPKYEVEGVHKITLGEETQMQIEVVVGSHVNSQYPWKFVEKAKIVECIEVGGELSEFFPLKEHLEGYEDKLVLMGYIADEAKDMDEFYICCTAEARDHCKQQSDRFIGRLEKKLLKSVQKKPRPWVSLGSAAEIIELTPINTRPLMEVEIKATYPTVYQPDKFKARDTNSCRDGFIELTPYRQKFNNVYRRRVDAACQAACAKEEKFAQTELRYPQNMWTQSIADAMGSYVDPGAGGDQPKNDLAEVFDEDRESGSSEDEASKQPVDEVGLVAFKNAFKRLRRPSYIKMINEFIKENVNEMDSIVELNTVMDIYSNDYPILVAEKTIDMYDSMTFEEYVCFTDVRAKDKYVSCAVFHPMWSGIVAICYADGSPTVMKYLGAQSDPIQRAVYGLNPVMIWSHTDSLIPKLYLECSREVKVLSFCPFNENILIGGCVNGQVVLWDLTNKLENVEKIEVLSETREKYKIAMNSHMWWMKTVEDKAVVQATAMSSLMTSHYGPINAVKWLSPRCVVSPTGKKSQLEEDNQSLMIFTGSEDGTILVWNLSVESVNILDSRKTKKSKRVPKRPSGLLVDFSPFKVLDRNLMPCYKIILGTAGKPSTLPLQTFAMDQPLITYTHVPTNSGTGRKYFKCEILPDTDISHTIYCSSQHGDLWKIAWEGHAFNTGEVVNSEYCDIKYKCKIHDGIITSTQRNPFLNDITMTVGGKVFAIWCEDYAERPLLWKKRPCRLTDAVWSLYKPSLLFIANSEGDLECWDLLLKSDQPIAVQTVSGTMLTGVSLHTLPLKKNMVGVSDLHGSFRMFLDPSIFMLENPAYKARMHIMIERELNVMKSFKEWQDQWMKNNPNILLEMRRKEGLLLAEKEEEKRKKKEEEEQRLEEEAEARRLARMKVIGPEERWQMIIQKLIERTIAVKKRINRAELIEHEKPLRELEAQRLEKEKRMLEIMKNQKTIFNDTVAILFPEAVKKPPKPKKTYLSNDRPQLKKEYLEDYEYLKTQAFKTVVDNPYKLNFSWEATLSEGKERRQALSAYEDYILMHKCRLDEEVKGEPYTPVPPMQKVIESVEEMEENESWEDNEL